MRSFIYQPVILRFRQIVELLLWYSENLYFKCVLIIILKKNEFNSTILWLRVTLLSISRSPLFCFLFSDYEQRDLGSRNGI